MNENCWSLLATFHATWMLLFNSCWWRHERPKRDCNKTHLKVSTRWRISDILLWNTCWYKSELLVDCKLLVPFSLLLWHVTIALPYNHSCQQLLWSHSKHRDLYKNTFSLDSCWNDNNSIHNWVILQQVIFKGYFTMPWAFLISPSAKMFLNFIL